MNKNEQTFNEENETIQEIKEKEKIGKSAFDEEVLDETKKIWTNPVNNIIDKDNHALKLNKKSNKEAGKKMEGMDGHNKTKTTMTKSILDTKSEKVGDEMDLPSNPDERENQEME